MGSLAFSQSFATGGRFRKQKKPDIWSDFSFSDLRLVLQSCGEGLVVVVACYTDTTELSGVVQPVATLSIKRKIYCKFLRKCPLCQRVVVTLLWLPSLPIRPTKVRGGGMPQKVLSFRPDSI